MSHIEEGSDPNAPYTAIIGIMGSAITVAIVLALQVLFYHTDNVEKKVKVIDVRSEQLIRIQAESMENLNSARVIDQAAGKYAIPIEHAKELVIREQRGIGN